MFSFCKFTNFWLLFIPHDIPQVMWENEKIWISSWFNYAHASKLKNWLFLMNIILFFLLVSGGGKIIFVIRANAINFLIWRKKMFILMGYTACRWTLTTRNLYSNDIVNFFWHLTTKWESAKWEKSKLFSCHNEWFFSYSNLI